MDFSNSLGNSCSDYTLSYSTSSFESKAYSKDTDEGIDKEINLILSHISMSWGKMMEKNLKNLHQKRKALYIKGGLTT